MSKKIISGAKYLLLWNYNPATWNDDLQDLIKNGRVFKHKGHYYTIVTAHLTGSLDVVDCTGDENTGDFYPINTSLLKRWEDTSIIEEPKVNYTPLDGKNIVSCRSHYEGVTVRDDEGYLYFISEQTLLSVLSEFEFHPEKKRTRTWLIPIFPPVMESKLIEEPQAEYRRKEIPVEKKLWYINTLQEQSKKLNALFVLTSPLFLASDMFGYDINDFIEKDYPFNFSFDELVTEVDKWVNSINEKISEERVRLEGVVEEPAPYYTKKEARGKWVCGVNTMLSGWDCVRHHTRDSELNGKPVLYDSKEEVETDDFFDPDNDFAILATEFLEGRKFFIGVKDGKKYRRIIGTPIVKEPEDTYPAPRPCIELKVGYKSEDAWYFDIAMIRIQLSTRTRESLLKAINILKENDSWMWAIEVNCPDEIIYIDDDDKEDDQYRAGAEWFRVSRYGIVFHSEHKHNSQCQIEGAEFYIDEKLKCISEDVSIEKILLPHK